MPPPPPGTPGRAPGAFSPLPTASKQQTAPSSSSFQTPSVRKVDTSYGDDAPLTINTRAQNAQAQRSPHAFTTFHQNNSTGSLQNFSRPTTTHATTLDSPLRTASPLTLPSKAAAVEFNKTHTRKHSNSQGFFEPSLSTSVAGLSPTGSYLGGIMPNPNLTASQIAAQAAMQHQGQHMRQRSQTLPTEHNPNGTRKTSRGPASPPLLSLTEASGERQSGFNAVNGHGGMVYRNGLLGGGTSAAATAANVVFQRSPQSSPGLPPSDYSPTSREPEKPIKIEKSSKVKLFSRPGKIGTKDTKEKPLPSPSKLGSYGLGSLQKGNVSTASLADSIMSGGSSMYSMANSSSATIRPIDAPPEKEKEKDKEKKHHFLSRQKHKLSNKDDHHLPLSSAASNSRPADPSAPSSLYNFSLPPSPGPTATSFAKSMSGLDLRHGGRALREKKKEEKAAAGGELGLRESDAAHQGSEWPGPSSLGSGGGPSYLGSQSAYAANVYGIDTQELAKYGLNNMTADDAWPFLKAKLLIIFEGEDLKLPVEDFNRLVTTHLQRCIQKRAPTLIIEDLRDLLTTGFLSLDQTLRRTSDDRLIPHLVELWLFTFTSILPCMQAVFLPLDLEFSGHGPLMTPEQAREFWGALPSSSAFGLPTARANTPNPMQAGSVPASQLLEVRRIVLTAYRDTVILPRFDTLTTIFSRLSLESINSHLPPLPPPPHHHDSLLSSSPDSFQRPGTAMSLDPSLASYGSQTTTLLGGADSSGVRSRAISNVSYGSGSDGAGTGLAVLQRAEAQGQAQAQAQGQGRPFTPGAAFPTLAGGSGGAGGMMGPGSAIGGIGALTRDRDREREREVNALEGKHVTETVGRMLQCMSVLASVGGGGDEEYQAKMEELCRALKLNWLGRGRTGRNRRGLVGARVKKEEGPPSML